MNKLLKEAIADAKAVRETALANAKIALEEAFTPRLQSMLSAKLSEEEGMEDEMAMEDEMPMDAAPEEAPVEEPAVEEPVAEEEGMEDDMAMEGDYGDEEVSETEMAAPEMEEPALDEEDAELEEILRELEAEEGDAVTEGEDEEETVEEQSGSTGVGSGDNKMKQASSSDEEDPGKGKLSETEGDEEVTEEEEVDLDEIINALREEEGDEEKVEEGDTAGVDDGAAEELEEAYKVIRFMKSKLNEVNLLNAKLLFSNKLFRNHSLSEGQKMKVIENFDRAQTLREVKLVFATLTESFKIGGRKKKSIKESYASKATRSTKPSRKVLSEGSEVSNRFKKLAGLI